MKKRAFALIAALVLLLLSPAAAEQTYRMLKSGSSGDDVKALKLRLYDLGYYRTTALNDVFNESAQPVIENFQYMNGLQVTGVADAYTQAVLFSDAAVMADGQRINPNAELPAEGTGGDGQYRTLSTENYGDDVLAAKRGLLKLGYYRNDDFNGVYNAGMADRVSQFQQSLGQTADGILTVAQQVELLGSRQVSSGGVATPFTVELPELDAEGYLADAGAAPFVYSDYEHGYWYYIDQELHIEIVRYTNPRYTDMSWYETEIFCKPSIVWQPLMSQGNREEGHNFEDGMTIADRGSAILAITDDNFGYRWYKRHHDGDTKYQQGVVIRNGIVRADAMPDESYYDFPPLDILAYYPDGSIEVYYPEEHDAQDYLNMGVLHTYCFGPILLRDGEVNQRLYSPSSRTLAEEYEEEAARQAIGYYEPGHYIIITANGDHDSRTGVKMQWMVDMMQQKGVKHAFNLDGGRTTLLYFMGQAVNKKPNVNRSLMREVTGMIGIGTAD